MFKPHTSNININLEGRGGGELGGISDFLSRGHEANFLMSSVFHTTFYISQNSRPYGIVHNKAPDPKLLTQQEMSYPIL